jgi:uncharacterized protein YjiS (DUF1127 family)
MSKVYRATVAAVVVTTSLASNILVVGTRSSLRPSLAGRLRATVRRWLRRFRHSVDTWVAEMIATSEQQAAMYALNLLSDRELRDIGLDRGSINHLVRHPEQWNHYRDVGMPR